MSGIELKVHKWAILNKTLKRSKSVKKMDKSGFADLVGV